MLKNRRGLAAVLLAVCAVGLTIGLLCSRPGLAADPAPGGKLAVKWQYAVLCPDFSETELLEVRLKEVKEQITQTKADEERMKIQARRRFESPSGIVRASYYPELTEKLGGKKSETWSDLLTTIGAQGWDLVGIATNERYIFKRPSP